MEKTRLGKTNLMVSRTAFGAIPMQRVSDGEASTILRLAYDGGVNYYDTARAYTTSERRIGKYLADVRGNIIIATKTAATNADEFEIDLAASLSELGGDSYIDIYQFHNTPFVPRPGAPDGLYDAALRAKAEGKIRHIGITSHSLSLAKEEAKSGLFETMQFPFSLLATDDEIGLVELCRKHDVGFIAMKAMAGGLITNAKPAFAFLRQFENVVPIWGVQRISELEEFLLYEEAPPELNDEMLAAINRDREQLSGGFCRGCGYCMPCPAEIQIDLAARMRLLLGRTNWSWLVNEQTQKMMRRINNCTGCNHCIDHCPYSLDTPALLRENLDYYEKFIQEH